MLLDSLVRKVSWCRSGNYWQNKAEQSLMDQVPLQKVVGVLVSEVISIIHAKTRQTYPDFHRNADGSFYHRSSTNAGNL